MNEEPQSTNSERRTIVVVDQSRDALDAARDRADARLDQELGQGGRFRRFVNGIWKGNIAKEFYRQRYTQDALHGIENAQDVLVHEQGVTAEDRTGAMLSTIERFQGDYDELIHAEAGEHREEQTEDSELAIGMKDLVRRYVESYTNPNGRGGLNAATLREEQTRLMNEYRQTHGEEAAGRGLVITDNMIAVAESVRSAVEHGESLDNIMANMRVLTGESRSGVRTEARYNLTDKIIDRLGSTRVGSLVGPEVTATAVTVALSLARLGSRSVIGAATRTILPGVGAGIWAGFRENKRVKDERAQHSREMAQGKVFQEGSQRREQMEQTRYESVSAADLAAHLTMVGNEETLREGGSDAVRAALDALAAVNTRVRLSDERKIDLISYSNPAMVGDERMALDIARAQVRVALEQQLNEEMRQELALGEAPLGEVLDQFSTSYIEAIDQDATAKDRAFRALKARRVMKSALVTTATAAVGGAIFQEAFAAFSPTTYGLIDQMAGAPIHPSADGMQHQTVLEGFIRGDQTTVHTGPSSHFETYNTTESPNNSIKLSNDHKLVENEDGTYKLVDPNGHASIDDLKVNPDGTLPQDSIDRLHQDGMSVRDLSFDKQITTTTTGQVDAHQLLQNHLADTTHVQRDLWYNNDTPHVFDKNELRLTWGGSGLTDHGFKMSVAGMTQGGSYVDGQSVSWSEAASSGHLMLALSASGDTQDQVFLVPISPDGTADIPYNSPAAHLFSQDGRIQFNGRYAEAVQVTGTEDGTTHIRPLATYVGTESPSFADQVTTTTTEHHAIYDITTNGYDTTTENFTELAPEIPVDSRRSLEAVSTRRERAYYYNGGEVLSSAEIEQRRQETSPRLLRDPNTELNSGQEYDWYRNLLSRRRGADYVASIDHVIDNTPELAELSADTEAIVTIPVHAAGQAEADNIYNLLSAYGGQGTEALQKTTLLLHVNWQDQYVNSQDGGASERENIERTRAEIARARIDLPELRVAVIETEYDHNEVADGVIGFVARKLNDSALLALDRAVKTGRMPSDHETLIIRNDADAIGISANYLRNFTKDFGKYGETDIFTGTTTFDSSKASRLPGFVFASNFMQSLNILSAKREGSVHTGGANFGIRGSTLAAIGGIGFDNGSGAGTDDVEIGRRVRSARDGAIATSRRARRNYAYQQSHPAIGNETNKRAIARRITARLETDSDRLEAVYLSGIPLIDSWSALDANTTFDQNGYRGRSAGLQSGVETTPAIESLRREPDKVIEHIRSDIEGSINIAGTSRAVIDSALAFTFGKVGTTGYRLTGGPGHYHLSFTNSGSKHILNHLTRDSRGRFDSYGARKMRQLYGQAVVQAKRQPTHQQLISI